MFHGSPCLRIALPGRLPVLRFRTLKIIEESATQGSWKGMYFQSDCAELKTLKSTIYMRCEGWEESWEVLEYILK